MIYLDHNATSPPAPGVVEAMSRAMACDWGNPSSVHRAGQRARAAIELARRSLAQLVGAKPGQLVLTSGGTESIATALWGAVPAGSTILASPVEHEAVEGTLAQLVRQRGVVVDRVGVDAHGLVDLAALEAELAQQRSEARLRVAAIQWANSQTGAIQPIELIAQLCDAHGVVLMCDATQIVGKRAVDLSAASVPGLVCLSCHKFGGPPGVGVLVLGRDLRLAPLLPGSQERGLRGGTENLPGIVAAGVAAQWAMRRLADPGAGARVESLRDELQALVLAGVAGSCVIGPTDRAQRLGTTLAVRIPGIEAQLVVMAMAERGVCLSAGSACSSGAAEPPKALRAMGLDERAAGEVVRLSLGPTTTRHEVVEAAKALIACVGAIRGD